MRQSELDRSERREYVRPARRVPWYISFPVTIAVIFGFFVAAGHFNWLPGLPNPFGERTVDRSGPAVLRSVQDMSRYEAAEGQYQVVVDLSKEAKYLPSSLEGSRTLYVGLGSVDAYVDLGGLASRDVTVSADGKSATLTLPHAKLSATALDPAHSYVFAEQRGLFDRIGGFFSSNPNSQQPLEKLAASKIQTAAKDSGLTQRAEANTKAAMTGLLHSLGFTNATVQFSDKA